MKSVNEVDITYNGLSFKVIKQYSDNWILLNERVDYELLGREIEFGKYLIYLDKKIVLSEIKGLPECLYWMHYICTTGELPF